MKLDNKKIKDRVMEIGYKTGCGHVASAMSCVNVLCDIYNNYPDEIIILSKGHGALAQYVILNELGKLSDEKLDSYYKDGGLSGHATLNPQDGIYASTGSLGHGLGIGIGYAIAQPKRKVVVIMGDGELDEGSTMEGLRILKKLELDNILTVVDVNDWQGFGEASEINFIMPRYYYSVKGEGFGDTENTLESHYTYVTDEVYKNWMENSSKIETKRLNLLNEYNEANNRQSTNNK